MAKGDDEVVMQALRVVLSIILFAAPGICFEAKDYVTYFGTTDKIVTVGWDAVANATIYELELYHQVID